VSIHDYFRSVETMTPEQVRGLMDSRRPEEYNLLDVRQPGEYRRGHLPGARLIPLAELAGRLTEFGPAKPTIAY